MKPDIKGIIKKTRHALFILIFLALAQQVLGYIGTNIGAIDMGIGAISNLFNIQSLQSNEFVRIGFLKFALFIVLFAVSNQGLKRVRIFNNRTAGITAFAFSMIGVFMMPLAWLLATGDTITAIMSSFIFLGFFIGLSVVAMFVLAKKGEDDEAGWIKNLLGLVLLFFLLILLDDWALFVGLPVERPIVGGPLVITVYSAMISWTYVLITILIIVKLILWASGWHRPGPGEGEEPPEPGEGEEPGEESPEEPETEPTLPPEAPPDFESYLQNLEHLLNEYDNIFRQFRDACNDVLQTHHDFVNSLGGYAPPSPPVSPAQWQHVFDLLHRLNELADEINGLINEIINHPDYSRMPGTQQAQFANLCARWTQYLLRTQNYRNDFIHRYTRGMPLA